MNVLSGTVNGGKATAGVVSRIMSNGAVKNCSNAADVTASGANCGGIVGAAYYNNAGGKSMSIENCTNTGNVTSTKGGVAGGIVGLSVSDVKGCTNSGTVTGNAASIGGIVGEQQNIGNVTDCINTGEVINTSNAYGTGGIIGWIRYSGAANIYTDKAPVTVKGCQNTAVVKSLGSVGGIIGVFYNHGTVTECTNTAQRLEAGTFVGGIVGSQQNDGPYIDGAEIMIYVTNNVSTTTLDNMTGTYKNQYVYVNTPSTITVEGNKDTID